MTASMHLYMKCSVRITALVKHEIYVIYIVSIYVATGLFVAPLIERYGSRRLTRIGSFVAFIGIATGAFAPNIYVLYLTFGLITGVKRNKIITHHLYIYYRPGST